VDRWRSLLIDPVSNRQFTPASWHGKIGEETLADAILDRIVHDSYIIFIEGKTLCARKRGLKLYKVITQIEPSGNHSLVAQHIPYCWLSKTEIYPLRQAYKVVGSFLGSKIIF